ncbi:sensor histidine kinase [Paenibacillus filicis]|uniref:histidine kinase n=1 Tax=Paenibacillus filicis TaxID=669464 RepID=A0ABU9DIX8_9BACL
MGRYRQYWNDRSIRFKLNCIFLLIILVSMLTLSIWGTRTYSTHSENQADQYTLQMIHQVESNVDFYIRHLMDVLDYIGKDAAVGRLMNLGHYDALNALARQQAVQTLRNFTERNPEIAGMMLVNRYGAFVAQDMHRITRDSLIEESWYKDAVSSHEPTLLISNPIGRNVNTTQTYSANDVLSLVHAVRDPSTGEALGVILMDVRMDMFKAIFDNLKLGKSGFIYIQDNKGNMVYAPNNAIVYRIRNEWFQDGTQGSLTKSIRGHDYRILYNDYSLRNWRIIGVIPNDDYHRVVSDIQLYTAVVTIVMLLLATLASTYFTGTIIRPVRKLMRLMSNVQNGDLNRRFVSVSKDEIGQLGNSFNHMLEEIKNLINMVYAEQKKKREAELQVLQAQIKPHFLYNTLDTIQWMAQDYKANDIVQMIGALTNLFRIGLNKGYEWIPIKDEVKHAESYLIIQMSRYMGKMNYMLDIPEDLHRYHVLKLILQPLIENAIYHGIKARTGKGMIRVSAMRYKEGILFRVEDDGAGMQPDKLEEINRILRGEEKRGEEHGYGLFNVNERVQLTYGSLYGIQIESEPGKGTAVSLYHPLVQMTKDQLMR